MNPEIAKLWVKALRSGKYPQATGALRRSNGLCCLGVLSSLHAEAHPEIAKTQTNPHEYLGEASVLPKQVKDWAGMKFRNGSFHTPGSSARCLAAMNDNGTSFVDIANVIKANVARL